MIDKSHHMQIEPLRRQGPFLITGLGNPGRKFEHNRHNVGFMLLNRISNRLGDSFTKVESKALVAKSSYLGERVILVKPQTYMNNSGVPVSSLVRYYQISLDHILIAYDDVGILDQVFQEDLGMDQPIHSTGVCSCRAAGGSTRQANRPRPAMSCRPT